MLFFLLTFLISWLIWLPGVLVVFGILDIQFDNLSYAILNIAGGFGPTIAGLLLFYRESGMPAIKSILKSCVDIRRVGRVWWIPLLLLMPIISLLALALGVLFGGVVPELSLLQQWWMIPVLFIGGFLPISNAFREEIGWRGYAIESLQSKHNALISSVIIGIAWGVWHFPLMLFPIATEVYSSTPLWVFMTNTIMLSIIMTWLYNSNSKSIFTALAFHVVANLSPTIFPFVKTEFGVYFNMILLIVTAVVIVAINGYENLTKEPPIEESPFS